MGRRQKPKQPSPFKTEVELCAAFIACVDDGWTPYAETGGFDILLVRLADGFQIGIHAKLKFNVEVVSQAVEDGYSHAVDGEGPDCRAVLVPEGGLQLHLHKICAYVGITPIVMRNKSSPPFWPTLPRPNGVDHDWHEMIPARRCSLPEYVPDVPAGASAPVQLTKWKIKAIKLAVLLEERGGVTRRDFAHLHLDHRRWIAMGWLKASSNCYVADAFPDFKGQHPRVYEEIKAVPQWRPVRMLIDVTVQEAMI